MKMPLRRNALAVAIATALPLMLRRTRISEQHQLGGAKEAGDAPIEPVDPPRPEEKAA